jgi:hypothetical protein
MPWQKKTWVPLKKHEPRSGVAWDKVVAETGEPDAKSRFKEGIGPKTAKKFQEEFESEGRLFSDRGHERYYYVICDEIIGASEGEETNIVKVKWLDSGTVHGQPYAESRLRLDLKKNPQEYDHYMRGREK